MAVAYFTTWSMFNERNGSKSDVAPTEDGTYIRELGGAEKFLSRKIPGTDKLVCPHGAVYIFDGAVDHDTLIDALELSLIRHHLLRSHVVIDATSGKEYFFANKSSISDMAKVILSTKEVPDKDFDSLWRNELEAVTNDGIFPAQGPLWWMKNFYTEEKKKTCWIFGLNHGINDQKSLNILVQELLDCVNNNNSASLKNEKNSKNKNENKNEKIIGNEKKEKNDEKNSENDETKTQRTESDDSILKFGPDCLPFPPALEVAVTPSVSIWKILQWAVPQMFYIPPKEASFVPTKLLENYKEDPVLYANYGCAEKRKTFIECFKLTKKETRELVEVCRFNRVTVTSALSAAMLSLTSSFIQNGTADDGRDEDLKTMYLKIHVPVDTRPFGDPFALEFQEDVVVIADGDVNEEEKREKSDVIIPIGNPDFPSVIHSDNNDSSDVDKDKTDWTRGAVMCAIGSVDYIISVPVKTVQHAREIYNELRSLDNNSNYVENAMHGETETDLDKNPEFWVLAKECRLLMKGLVENNLGEHLLYSEFMLKQANLEDTIAADAANPLTMGRSCHCSVSNVGIAKIKTLGISSDLDDNDSIVPPILKLRDAYFTSGSAFNGFFCTVYSMTVEDSLCLCLNFTSPVSSREEGLFFKDCFLAMLREQIIQ